MVMGEMMEGFLEQISQMAPMMQSNDNPFVYLKRNGRLCNPEPQIQ